MKMSQAKKKLLHQIKGILMSKLEIDQNKSIYYEFLENKQNTYNFVF